MTEDVPGPGKYSPQKPPKNQDFSQAVFHHTTETMEETKKMVKNATTSDVPGPGAYTLPDLPNIHGVPSFQGRQLPFAVPRPYHYNAQPDLGRKFFQPLRASNSGDLIFGRNFKAGKEMLTNFKSGDAGAALEDGSRQTSKALTNNQRVGFHDEELAINEERMRERDAQDKFDPDRPR